MSQENSSNLSQGSFHFGDLPGSLENLPHIMG